MSDHDDPTIEQFEAAVSEPIRASWVFVSHSATDYDAVRRLMGPFEGSPRFLTLHIANRAQGEQVVRAYRSRIIRSLSRCAWFVVFVSRASVESKWVRLEVEWAISNRPKNRIICLTLDNADPTALSPALQTVRGLNVGPLLRPATGPITWWLRKRLDWLMPSGTEQDWFSGTPWGK